MPPKICRVETEKSRRLVGIIKVARSGSGTLITLHRGYLSCIFGHRLNVPEFQMKQYHSNRIQTVTLGMIRFDSNRIYEDVSQFDR